MIIKMIPNATRHLEMPKFASCETFPAASPKETGREGGDIENEEVDLLEFRFGTTT